MFCLRCGYPSDNRRFCTECGTALYDTQVEPEPAGVAANRRTIVPHHVPAGANALIGLMIDQKYHLESKIGDGGMGSVYRARRMLIGDNAAIKVLRADQITDSETVERFRREAQTAARLKHPNVVSIYDFGISKEGLIYLVMELVEGETLRRILEREGVLSEVLAVEIIRQVCEALEEAHRSGVVHRDVKPDNIVVQVTNGGLSVKVLDFGIAALRDVSPDKLTEDQGLVGTPHYMSPEHCLGDEPDGRSDIYSLGIILYEMLTGFVPFDSPTPSAIFVQQVTQYPPPLSEVNPSISSGVEAVVLKALEKQRELRPQSARALSRDLMAAVDGPCNAESIRGAGLLPVQYLSMIDSTHLPDKLVEPVTSDYEDLLLDQEQLFTDEATDDGLISKLRLSMLVVLALLLITVGIWFYLSKGEVRRAVSRNNSIRNGAQNLALAAQPPAVVQNAVAAETPAAAPAPSTLWDVIADQTTGVTDATNMLGLPDQQLAVIKPLGQIALVYREGQFFSNGPGPDLRIYAPNQSRISYTVFVRDEQAGDWQRIDQNRRWFPRGVNEHDIKKAEVRQAHQLLIINNGKTDLKIDAIKVFYQTEADGQSVTLSR